MELAIKSIGVLKLLLNNRVMQPEEVELAIKLLLIQRDQNDFTNAFLRHPAYLFRRVHLFIIHLIPLWKSPHN